MQISFIASVSTITADPAASRAFFDGLGVEFGEGDADYPYTTKLDGVKHFGLWRLSEAAEVCFGTSAWPADRPVPQASIEFEVPDVAAAVAELTADGYTLIPGERLEEWGQTTARLQSPEGLLVGVVWTPWMEGEEA
jgi:catechol 2,3-dioxygenase-like lactoylglutathione lyase family enzyme